MLDLYIKYKLATEIMIPLVIVLLIVSFLAYSKIKFYLSKRFKNNCFDCMNYRLKDVASVGDGCSYACSVFKNTNNHKMNDKYNFIKCDKFEKK